MYESATKNLLYGGFHKWVIGIDIATIPEYSSSYFNTCSNIICIHIPKMGVPNSWMVYKGESENKMDDN